MSRASPTILQIIPRLDTGGAELSTIESADAVASAGGRALVATEGGRMAARISAVGGELHKFPASTKNPLRILANAASLRKLFSDKRIDLVHARSRAPAWSARLAARGAGIPFVTTYHGAYAENDPLKRFYNSVMASADRVIANSRYTARLIKDRYGTDAEKIRVIHRGVDMRAFDPDTIGDERVRKLRAEWQIDRNQRVVLQAARLTSWKGQRVVLDAAGRLASEGRLDSVVFVFAGDDQGRSDYREQLMRHAASLGIVESIRFPGHVADMAGAFATAHLAIVASTKPEAFGRTGAEAQAMRCPVIATNIGAPPETVIAAEAEGADRATGWLVPPGNPAALAETLARALALTEGQRAELGARARTHVAANFTLDTMKRATLAVYDELLGSDLAQRWPEHSR